MSDLQNTGVAGGGGTKKKKKEEEFLILTTVEWVGFKLTFLEKDICHDHEIDILRSLAKLPLRYV